MSLQRGADRVVGLWKDAFHNKSFELHCPYGYQGVWLKLWSSQVTDYALDGRDDQHGKIWIYGKHEPVAIPDCTKRYPAILGRADCAASEELAAGAPTARS